MSNKQFFASLIQSTNQDFPEMLPNIIIFEKMCTSHLGSFVERLQIQFEICKN